MKKIGVPELKQIQLSMMDDIHAFCETNHIRYVLAYGTLIGAIRHQGYIPWDDDIDIMMPRPDYDRFIQTYNNRQSPYKMVCFENNKNSVLPFGKVHDTRTIIDETQYHQNNSYGVYIDVFPIDGFDSDAQLKKAQKLRRMLNAKKAKFGKGRSLLKEFAIFVAKLYLLPRTVYNILEETDRIVRSKPFEESELAGYLSSLNTGRKGILPRIVFEESTLSSFDGRFYRIPVAYDMILTQEYGDYMQIPPEEKRISTHVFEAWWKES